VGVKKILRALARKARTKRREKRTLLDTAIPKRESSLGSLLNDRGFQEGDYRGRGDSVGEKFESFVHRLGGGINRTGKTQENKGGPKQKS